MKTTLGIIAVAGLASAAAAGGASLSIVASAASVDTTGAAATMTLAIYGDASVGTAIAGGEFALTATGGDIVSDMSGVAAAWGALGEQDNGHAGSGNYNGLIFGQLIFPPFINPAAESMLGAGPVLLGNVTVTIAADSSGVIDWSTAAGPGAFVLEVFTDNGAEGVFTQYTDVAHGSASVTVTPAPSAMALLGLGGIVAGRRRR